MPTSRRLAVLPVALAVAAAVLPAYAGPGPVPLDTHDSYIPARAFEMSSSAAGTVFAADAGTGIFGHVYLVRAPMTTGSAHVDLGDRAPSSVDGSAPSIRGTQVAVPVVPTLGGEAVTAVKYCAAATCPTTSTYTVPAGWRYLGNGEDRALIYHEGTHTLGLAPWNGTAATNIVLPPEAPAPATATGDTTGVLLTGGGTATYVNRSTSAVTVVADANLAVLTPTFVVWYLVATGAPAFDTTAVRAVARSAPAAPYSTLASLPGAPDFNTFAANDSGVAWLLPQDDGSTLLYTLPIAGGTPTLYPRNVDSTGLAPFEGGATFLVNDSRAGIPGFYEVTPGSTGGTLTGLLPVRQAITRSLSVSNSRALYADDMTDENPVFLRAVPNGVPDATETTVSASSRGSVSLSGPYVAFTRPGQVVYGRAGGTLHTTAIPAADLARVQLSGRRLVVTGGMNARLVDVVTGAVTALGHVYATLFGEYLVTLNYDTGLLQRRILTTGAVQTIRGATCTSSCVDEEGYQLAAWGNEVAYAFVHAGASPALSKGVWDGTTGTHVSALNMLGTLAAPAYYEFRYWDGLLLVYRRDFTLRLYSVRAPGTDVEVESYGDAPMDLDGHVVAWRRLTDLRAVVRPLSDLAPGYDAAPRYLGGTVPDGFGDGSPEGGLWKPSFLVSQDVSYTLQLHSGSAAGPVVRTLGGSSLYGEAAPVWDGEDTGGSPVPQGTYWWTLTGTGAGALALKNAAGTATTVSGSVYVSRSAPTATATLSAPVLASDVSTTATFPVSWGGAPAGLRYTVQRSVNGGAFGTLLAETAATSTSFAGSPGNTYRFRVAVTDAAGRLGPWSAIRTTVVPYDDRSATFTPSWAFVTSGLRYLSTHHYSGTAGATMTFTATGNVIYLVGGRGASYGQFQVSVDGGAYSAPIDTYAAATQYRRVLFTRSFAGAPAAHTIKVRVVGTSGRPLVSVDGLGYRR
jgi:hypothetical protein